MRGDTHLDLSLTKYSMFRQYVRLDRKARIFQQQLSTQGAAAQVRVRVVWRMRTCERAKYQ